MCCSDRQKSSAVAPNPIEVSSIGLVSVSCPVSQVEALTVVHIRIRSAWQDFLFRLLAVRG